MFSPNRNRNYPASYEKESQSQSSCSQCRKNACEIRQQQQESSSDLINDQNGQSSSSQEQQVPLKKLAVSQSYQIEHTLKLLQYEIDDLKRQNQAKDRMIGQLKYHLNRTVQQQQIKMQMGKQALEINRLRIDLRCSPRNNPGTMFPSTHYTKTYDTKDIRSMQSRPSQIINSAQKQHTSHYPKTYQMNTFQFQHLNSNYKQTELKDVYRMSSPKNNQSSQLKIAILEKQIREYQLDLIQLQHKMKQVQEQSKWQHKFIYSFIKMCLELSRNYGQRLILNRTGDDLKKKTKICWQYMKNLISQFLNISSHLHNPTKC